MGGASISEWAPMIAAIAAYVFGVATGWLLWYGARNGKSDASGARANGEPVSIGSDGPRLEAIQREIESARGLLDEDEEAARLVGDELNALDAAIKRTNGRLKVILRAIKRFATDR